MDFYSSKKEFIKLASRLLAKKKNLLSLATFLLMLGILFARIRQSKRLANIINSFLAGLHYFFFFGCRFDDLLDIRVRMFCTM